MAIGEQHRDLMHGITLKFNLHTMQRLQGLATGGSTSTHELHPYTRTICCAISHFYDSVHRFNSPRITRTKPDGNAAQQPADAM